MNLIDSDALIDYIESDESGLMSAREFQRDYIECIEEMPTAYDIDMVISKMEMYIYKQSENEMLSDNNKRFVTKVIEECIKIVKSGGV